MERGKEPEEQRHICTIYKSAKHEVRVSLNCFRGRRFGDLRLFVTNKQGEIVATKKGITIDVKQLHELEEAVWKLRDASDPTMHPPS
jgi:hypothetical protein